MNVFWVFIPGPVLLVLALLYFNWRQRKQQPAALPEKPNEELNGVGESKSALR